MNKKKELRLTLLHGLGVAAAVVVYGMLSVTANF